MTRIERTVTVDADLLPAIVPDWSTVESVSIDITATNNSLYLKPPDWSSWERKIRRLQDRDRSLHIAGDVTIDQSTIETESEALSVATKHLGVERSGVPESRDQFCTDTQSIIEASVALRKGWIRDTDRIKPQRSVIITDDEQSVVSDVESSHRDSSASQSEIGDVVIKSSQDVHPTHKRLCEQVRGFLADLSDSDYWQGYKAGSEDDWDTVAWEALERDFELGAEMLADSGEWMATTGQTVCQRTSAWFPIGAWSIQTGSYVATTSELVSGQCPDCGADKNEHWECTRSSNRTRVANRYQCQQCGLTKNGITTG